MRRFTFIFRSSQSVSLPVPDQHRLPVDRRRCLMGHATHSPSLSTRAGMVESEVSNMRGHIVGRSEFVDSSACLHSCVVSPLSLPHLLPLSVTSNFSQGHVSFDVLLCSLVMFRVVDLGWTLRERCQSEFWCHPWYPHPCHLLSTARSSCIAQFLLCSIFL